MFSQSTNPLKSFPIDSHAPLRPLGVGASIAHVFLKLHRDMKKLLVIRHAKAAQESPTGQDFDRPLTERGKADAKALAHLLQKERVIPKHIVSSPAIRALETATVLANHFDFSLKQILARPELYNADLPTLVESVQHLEPSWESAWLIGHNQGLSDLCAFLSADVGEVLSTANAIYFSLPVQDWKELRENQAVVLAQFAPRAKP